LVNEYFGLTVQKQKKMAISKWYKFYKIAVKRHKEKIELLSLSKL